MPQLDFFWWGMKFLFCWFFYVLLYVYLMNTKFLLMNSGFSSFSGLSYSVFSFSWLW